MPTFRVQINVAGFNELRNSPEVVALMEDLAGDIKARATANVIHKSYPEQDPFAVGTVHNKTRAVTFIRTASEDGEVAEAVNRTLTKALG